MKLQKTPIAFAFALIGAAPLVAQAAPTVSFKKPDAGAIISRPINQSSACEVTGTTNIRRVVFAVAPSDILSRASADIPFAEQSGYTAQVIKTYTRAQQLAESGIHGSMLPNGETLRFGKVADPMNSRRKALAFQVHTSDPITSSGKRSELSMNPNIEMNKVYWITFSVFVYDWGTLSTKDEALFGTQMHTGDNDAKVGGPSFGIYTTPGGRRFFVKTRYSESSTPSSSNSVSIKHAAHDIPFGRWADFVIKFKHNTSGNGFLQAWMDGQRVANYTGSLGYNTGMADYAKFGYYNWSRTRMGPTARKVLLRSPTIVADPTGSKYSQQQVRTLLGGSSLISGGGTTTASSSGACSTTLEARLSVAPRQGGSGKSADSDR